MPGDFGEFTVNIGLGINFLAGGTLFLNSNDTLSYEFSVCLCILTHSHTGYTYWVSHQCAS